jgi:hypothetical protein
MSLLLTACGNPPKLTTDPVFVPYIKEYEQTFNTKVHMATINFAQTNPKYAAVCYQWGPYGEILVSKETWKLLTDLQKVNLIFHELGHCHKWRRHKDTLQADYCPVSFMYYQIMPDQCLSTHWNEYIQEMM